MTGRGGLDLGGSRTGPEVKQTGRLQQEDGGPVGTTKAKQITECNEQRHRKHRGRAENTRETLWSLQEV